MLSLTGLCQLQEIGFYRGTPPLWEDDLRPQRERKNPKFKQIPYADIIAEHQTFISRYYKRQHEASKNGRKAMNDLSWMNNYEYEIRQSSF